MNEDLLKKLKLAQIENLRQIMRSQVDIGDVVGASVTFAQIQAVKAAGKKSPGESVQINRI